MKEGMATSTGVHKTRFIGGSGGGNPNAFSLSAAVDGDGNLKITMRGGRVIWHHHAIDIPTTVFDGEDGLNIWLEMDSLFPPDLETPPTITAKSGTDNEASRPENDPPARKYWQIGDISVSGDNEATINQVWDGHISWPGVWAWWM